MTSPLARLIPDPEFSGPDVAYTGPPAVLATVAESVFWPLSDDDIHGAALSRGWSRTWSGRPATPYGPGPEVTGWQTADGVPVLWIRDYGRIPGGELRGRQLSERLFWILWKAGVRTLLAGTHAGAADWRVGPHFPGESVADPTDPTDPTDAADLADAADVADAADPPDPTDVADVVRPGDLVIPWSFESRSWFNGLPGTEFESTMNNPKVVHTREIPWPYMDDPFAAAPATHLVDIVEPLRRAGRVRRVWTPEHVRAVVVDVDNIGFESHFDVYSRMATCKAISAMQPDRPPVLTLHGVTLNPVLCRLLSIEHLPYQVISNPAPGVVPDMSADHDAHVYSATEAEMWLNVELDFLSTYRPAPPAGRVRA